MRYNELLPPLDLLRDLAGHDAGGGGGEDGVVPGREAADLGPDLALQVQVLGNALLHVDSILSKKREKDKLH